jgi:serine/threonine-protein kinase
MICASCGADTLNGKRFCTACGAALVIPETVDTTVVDPRRQASSPPNEMAGRIVEGKYRIGSVLGHGGMGVVYRATRVLIGDTVALKLLHNDRLQDTGSRDRFQREAQAAARLKHENAVTIYDFGVTSGGLVYLVMELVEGESLAEIIRSRGALPLDLCLDIMKQVCAAVAEAHRHNIIHRDLKPDNIIVRQVGRGTRVKVLDFGIAKLQDPDASRLTQTGTVIGTPHYMSPEQCMGEQLDGRSDIYSIGIVLFEMLTGRLPFNATTPSAAVVQQVTQGAPSPRSINPSISDSIERVVLRALEKPREKRPQSAEDFYNELAAAASGSPSPPATSPAATRVGPALPNYLAGPVPTPSAAGAAKTAEPEQSEGATRPNRKPQPTVNEEQASPSGFKANPGQVPYEQPGYNKPGHDYSGYGQPGYDQPVNNPQSHNQQSYSQSSGVQGYPQPGPPSQPRYPRAAPANSRTTIFALIVIGVLILAVGAVLVGALVLNRPVPTINGNVAASDPTPSPSPSRYPPSPPVNLEAVSGEVMDTLNEWAAAITARDLDSLMSHYADQVQPYYLAKSASAGKVRQDMVRAYYNYQTTTIKISNLSVEPAADGLHVTARFDKAFDFAGEKRFTGLVQEEMWLSKTGGQWMITGLADLRVYYSNSTPTDQPTP